MDEDWNTWNTWNGNPIGPKGFDVKNFEAKRRDGQSIFSVDWSPWSIGYIDWSHSGMESDIVAYRFVD